MAELTGTVKWFDAGRRGYGFIRCDDGRELFVHRTEVLERQPLETGERVAFEIQPAPRGPVAVGVRRIGEPTSVRAAVNVTTEGAGR